MIANYTRPRLEIAQFFTQLPDRSTDRRVPLIIGIQYDLSRYGKETVEGSLFDTSGQTLYYTFADGGDGFAPLGDRQVDLSGVRVFSEDLEASLGSFSSVANGLTPATAKISLFDANSPTILKIEGGNFRGPNLAEALRGRSVAVGDALYIDDGNKEYRRVVTGFLGQEQASSFGQNVAKDDSLPGASAYNPPVQAVAAVTTAGPVGYTTTADISTFDAMEKGPVVDGRYGDELILTVTTGGAPGVAAVSVTSRSGLFTSVAPIVTVDDGGDFEISTDASLAGVSVIIEGPNLTAGQVFKVKVYGEYDPLVLSGGSANVLISGTYSGTVDTTYMIKVKTGVSGGGAGAEFDGAVVTISDTLAADTITDVTLTTDTEYALGNFGLRFEFNNATIPAQGGLKAGDIYFVHAKAKSASSTDFDKVILDGPAVDTSLTNSPSQGLDVDMVLPYTGEILSTAALSGTAWTADSNGISIQSTLSLNLPERSGGYQWVAFRDGVGYLFPSFRAAALPSASEGVIDILSSNDLISKLGAVDLENPISYGASSALLGSLNTFSNKTVKALRVSADTREAYETALAKIESMDNFYTLAPMSNRSDVHAAVNLHVSNASAPAAMNYRKAYVGVDSPGEWAVKSGESATISDLGGSFVRVTFTGTPSLNSLSLSAGDKIRVPSISTSFEIQSVVSDNELILKTGPASPISPAVPVDIIKADTPKNTEEFLNSRAKNLGFQKTTQVWSDKAVNFSDGTFQIIPSMYLAAEVAGLRCAVRPHQGITRTELGSVISAPNMYLRFSETMLNSIAANGTMIVTQDVDNGPVYIRHQLTTQTSKGALYYEDSVSSNVDEISFAIKDVFSNYIGKRNVNSRTVLAIRDEIVNILNARTQVPDSDILGPQLISWDSLDVRVDPQVSDRIIVKVRLVVPLPLNNLTIELTIDQSVGLAA